VAASCDGAGRRAWDASQRISADGRNVAFTRPRRTSCRRHEPAADVFVRDRDTGNGVSTTRQGDAPEQLHPARRRHEPVRRSAVTAAQLSSGQATLVRGARRPREGLRTPRPRDRRDQRGSVGDDGGPAMAGGRPGISGDGASSPSPRAHVVYDTNGVRRLRRDRAWRRRPPQVCLTTPVNLSNAPHGSSTSQGLPSSATTSTAWGGPGAWCSAPAPTAAPPGRSRLTARRMCVGTLTVNVYVAWTKQVYEVNRFVGYVYRCQQGLRRRSVRPPSPAWRA
jgi:hypothetical protein